MDTSQSDAGRLLADWPHLYRPGTGPESGPGLLMLHGTGGNEQEIAGLAAEIAPGAAVLAPRGRVREHGMLRWFRRHGEGVFDVDDVTDRAGELAGFVRAAVEHYGLRDRELVAVGFSNGANIALATAMLHPEVLPRAIALSGMYPFADRDPARDLTGSRVLLVNGERDQIGRASCRERVL